MKPYKTGFVLGKFCPPHKGHLYLIDVAKTNCDTIYVAIDNIMDDIFPLEKRKEWISKIFPEVNVLILPMPLPQDPSETPNFWNIWRKAIRHFIKVKIDCVFASENYGYKLANELEADFYPVDLNRTKIPVSATSIRNDIFNNWDFLPFVVQNDLKASICIFGPESTGKTTLSRQLADFFNCPLVPEFAEEVIRNKKGNISLEDMKFIAFEQDNRLKQLQKRINPLLIADTDAITTKLWIRELFDEYPGYIEKIIKQQKFDLYLLMDIDLEWENDIHRYRPEGRKEFFENCKKTLELYQRPYRIITGRGESRFKNALNAIYSRFPYLCIKQI